MPFDESWVYPEDHFLTEQDARDLLAGPLGEQQRGIFSACCAPIYWHRPDAFGNRPIPTNGTATFVQSSERLFGVTAAHVIEGYQAAAALGDCVLQIGNAALDLELIAFDRRLDLATFVVPPAVLRDIGKPIAPVSLPRPGDEPQEGRGIFLGGYIGSERVPVGIQRVSWGVFYACGVARRVNALQISWKPDHDHHVPMPDVPALAAHQELGGTSGGPMLAWFEKAHGQLAWCSLAGIIVEQSAELEMVVARRAEYINADGSLAAA